MSEASPAPIANESAPQGETATAPSVAGGAELGANVKGRAAAIERARQAIEASNSEVRQQAVRQATEGATKERAKAERDKATSEQNRDEGGRFKPALSPKDAKEQAKAEDRARPTSPDNEKPEPAEDDQSELEKLEAEWRKVRSSKKAARNEKRAAAAWRDEQARAAAEREADQKLKAENPAAWLEKHGFDFREEAKRAVAKQDESPAEKRAKEAEERARKAEERVEAIERREREREAARAQEEALGALRKQHSQAWQDTSTDYPTLSAHYSTDEILETALELRLDYFKKTGREVPVSAAFSHMEKLAKAERERFNRQQPEKAKPERTERATVAPKGAKSRAVVGPVTNREASTNSAPPAAVSPAERRARATEIAARGWKQ